MALKRIANFHHTAVLVVNIQITHYSRPYRYDSPKTMKPSLGLTWAKHVNKELYLFLMKDNWWVSGPRPNWSYKDCHAYKIVDAGLQLISELTVEDDPKTFESQESGDKEPV